MTTKFKVIVHKLGRDMNDIISMTSSHNLGDGSINLEDITGYIKARKALYPSLYAAHSVKPDLNEPNIIHLSEDDGKTFYLSVQECTYEELIDNPVLNQYAVANLSQAGEQC